MKKIILYYPQIYDGGDSKPLYTGIPLSVLTLTTQLPQNEYEFIVIDGRIENSIEEKLAENITDDTICLGISALTSYQIKDGLDIAQKTRHINPKLPVVWGGWHPSLMPDQTISHDLVDIVVRGQADITFPKLVRQLEARGDLSEIDNIIYKDKKIIKTELQPLGDLNGLQPIQLSYDTVNLSRYIQPLWGNEKVIGYESSRGCPWRCSFCSIGSVYNRRWHGLSADHVAQGVEYLVAHHDIDAIHFFDNNFFVNHKRAMAFCSQLIEKKIKINWDGTGVVKQFLEYSHDDIMLLKKSGFYRIILGIESGDEGVLKRINKQHNREQVIEVVKKCNKYSILPSLSFMLGFPWNPEEDVVETLTLIEDIKKITPQAEILLFIFSPYLGTELFDVALDYGMEFPKTLEEWADHTYDKVNIPWLSDKLIRKINRYISFFGTREMSTNVKNFLQQS